MRPEGRGTLAARTYRMRESAFFDLNSGLKVCYFTNTSKPAAQDNTEADRRNQRPKTYASGPEIINMFVRLLFILWTAAVYAGYYYSVATSDYVRLTLAHISRCIFK